MGVWDYLPLWKNFSRNGATWCMTEFCLGIRLAGSLFFVHTHFVNEEEHKALFAKSDVKKQDP